MTLEKRVESKSVTDGNSVQGSRVELVVVNKHSYIIDAEGNVISEYYDTIYNFKNGLAVVVLDSKMNVINQDGKQILAKFYDKLYVDGNVIRICKSEMWGFAIRSGKVICAPKFAFLEKFVNGYAKFQTSEGKWGIVNSAGHMVVLPKYDYIGSLSGEIIVAKDYRGYGGIDIHEKEVIPFRYEKIGSADEHTFLFNDAKDKIVV